MHSVKKKHYCIFISVSSMSYQENMKINATVNILWWNCWSVSFTNTIKPLAFFEWY